MVKSHMMEISQKLKQNVDDIEKMLKEDLDKVIEDAIDVILYTDLATKEPVGFDIGITIGSPNIFLTYRRGTCKIEGYWGSYEAERYLDREVCEDILERLTE